MGKVAKELNPKTHYDRAKKILLGKPGVQGGFISADIEDYNRNNALMGYKLQQNIMGKQGGQLDTVNAAYNEEAAVDPNSQVAAEIENRRRALEVANRGADQDLSRNLARRGLGGSAAGLFAQQRQQLALQDQLAALEGSRGQLGRDFADRKLNRTGELLNQFRGVVSTVERPYLQTTVDGTPAGKGALGAVGGVIGGIYGGPAGAAAGKAAGDSTADALRPADRRRY